jgi:hypothetical protein
MAFLSSFVKKASKKMAMGKNVIFRLEHWALSWLIELASVWNWQWHFLSVRHFFISNSSSRDAHAHFPFI